MKTTLNENGFTPTILTEKLNASLKNEDQIFSTKDLLMETVEMYWGEDYLVNTYEIIKTSPIYEEF